MPGRQAPGKQGPLRLEAQDIALSRREQGFESPRGRQFALAAINLENVSLDTLIFWKCENSIAFSRKWLAFLIMQNQYTAPARTLKAFNCPHCGAFAHFLWPNVIAILPAGAPSEIEHFAYAICSKCNSGAFWHKDKLVFPVVATAPLPNPDMPPEILADYEEARSIAALSPRGAAALLRLCIQKICIQLGEKGQRIDDDIASLVSKGLSTQVQKALDTVRVVGNDAVHPGTIDLRDTPEFATSLFDLVNFIVEKMISEPKKIEALYSALPTEKREYIERRDRKTEQRKED